MQISHWGPATGYACIPIDYANLDKIRLPPRSHIDINFKSPADVLTWPALSKLIIYLSRLPQAANIYINVRFNIHYSGIMRLFNVRMRRSMYNAGVGYNVYKTRYQKDKYRNLGDFATRRYARI